MQRRHRLDKTPLRLRHTYRVIRAHAGRACGEVVGRLGSRVASKARLRTTPASRPGTAPPTQQCLISSHSVSRSP
jgi:hypothetical protein